VTIRKKRPTAPSAADSAGSPHTASRLLHELRVHQVELESQNEELRGARRELEQSRSRYFDLYDRAPVGYCTVSETGLILESNLTLTSLLGVERDALAQQRLSRFIRTEDADAYHLFFKKLLETEEPQALELGMVKPDGTQFVARLTATTARDADGSSVRRFVLGDITERRRSEQALAVSAELLERTGAVAHVGGWELDLKTSQVSWSRETCRIHEIDPSETPALDEAIDYYAPEARPVIAAVVQAAIDSGTPWDLELPMITAKGRPIWVRSQGLAVMENGKAVRVLGAFHDITAHRQADDALRTMSRAVEQSPASIIITDRAGIIEYVNPRFEQLTGYTRAEVVGRNPRILKSGQTPDATYREMWKAIAEGGEWHGELCNRSKNGEPFWEFAAISGLKDESGSVSHFIAVKEDITARKRAEATNALLQSQLVQSQRMEAVGLLAGGVAHEFNNMLAVILGNIELGLRQVDPSQPLHADLLEVHRAAERSAELTRQLLAFARSQPVAPRVLDLNATVPGMLTMLQRLIGEDIQLAWQPAAQLWPITMDPAQMDQILTNLVVNARHAIAGIGTLAIATANCVIDADYCATHAGVVPGEYVRLTVTDSGSGMDAATVRRVFDPFFTTRDVGKGTGLGLSMVYGAVKQNNGFIMVTSAPGDGTTFEIHLPRHAAD
jgi:PAS domain S-box-containing protein